ncbi:MAG: YidB family protein [Burkholderiales bacterium]|nr:YidB family protein [Burkholderiales bacterium]
MARGFPSMTALLGLLAVAGFQNRDRIVEMLRGSGTPGGDTGAGSGAGGTAGSAGGAGTSGLLGGGIGELLERFQQSGRGETVKSWVGTGPNREISPDELEQAIGGETLAELATKTGLSRQELLARLSRDLPTAVDSFTPDGRIPRD